VGNWTSWFSYLADHPAVTEVLVTGGDPLTLADHRLEALLSGIGAVPGQRVVRIGTRAPVVEPRRVTKSLVRVLRSFSPLYLHTQFNCPEECTRQSGEALERLADAGVNLGNQMVLLRGVNDCVDRIAQVNEWLVRHRCRPYYLFVAEPVRGTSHLWVPLDRAKDISRELRSRLSGIAMPLVVQDQPSGGGKVPVELL
jgi:lysine 2,3-aminomutase